MRAPLLPIWCSSSHTDGNQSCHEQPRRVLALLLREHVHVAVVVVADVGVIEYGIGLVAYSVPTFLLNQSVTMIWPSGLRLGTSTKITLSRIFFTAGESSVARRWTSSERHLRRADLGRVDAAGDEQHQLALPEDLVALGVGRRAALEVELAFELLVAVEVLQRVRRG